MLENESELWFSVGVSNIRYYQSLRLPLSVVVNGSEALELRSAHFTPKSYRELLFLQPLNKSLGLHFGCGPWGRIQNMVHLGASDSSWQMDRKEERQSKRVTTKHHASLHLSTFFSCDWSLFREKG